MLPPDESDCSSSSISSDEISSSTSSPPTKAALATTTTAEGTFAAVLNQLRIELAEERRKREILEARQRELTLHLYYVIDEQIRGVKAMKKLVQSVREGKEDHVNEMVAIMKRMKTAWGKKRPRTFNKRIRCTKKSD